MTEQHVEQANEKVAFLPGEPWGLCPEQSPALLALVALHCATYQTMQEDCDAKGWGRRGQGAANLRVLTEVPVRMPTPPRIVRAALYEDGDAKDPIRIDPDVPFTWEWEQQDGDVWVPAGDDVMDAINDMGNDAECGMAVIDARVYDQGEWEHEIAVLESPYCKYRGAPWSNGWSTWRDAREALRVEWNARILAARNEVGKNAAAMRAARDAFPGFDAADDETQKQWALELAWVTRQYVWNNR